MEGLRKFLFLYFFILTGQLVFLQQLVVKEFSLHALVTPLYYFGVVYILMAERLKTKHGKDYWGYLPEDQKNKVTELIIQGQQVESDLEEDFKEERFLRVAGMSSSVSRKLSLVIHFVAATLLSFLFHNIDNNYHLQDQLIPFIIGGLALITTSYGQLIAMPLLTLLLSISQVQNFTGSHFLFMGISLWLTLALTRLVILLPRLKSDKTQTTAYQTLSKILKEVGPPTTILLISFALFQFILPNPKTEEVTASPPIKSPIEVINKKLGKTYKSPPPPVRAQRELIKNFAQQKKLKGKSFQQTLKTFEKQLDFYKDFLNSELFKNLPIPEMDKNLMKNSYRELESDYKNLQALFNNKQSFTNSDIKAAFDFFHKLEKLQDEFNNHNFSTEYWNDVPPISASETFRKGFGELMKENLPPINKVQGDIDDQLKKDFQDLLSRWPKDSKGPNESKDPQKKTLTSFSEFEDKIEKLNLHKEELKEAVLKAKEEESHLIPPQLLERLLGHLKKLFFLVFGLGLLQFIYQLFTKREVKGTSTREMKELKKEYLKRITYPSAKEEIWGRYNIFLEAIKKVYFPNEEEQVPPPKILEYYLKNNQHPNAKAVNYLTEVFSRSFYGGQDFPVKVLKNYRKAFKTVIKNL